MLPVGMWIDRTPSIWEKIIILLLLMYAVVVIAPDTLRVAPALYDNTWLRRWYPVATLGFQSDNDGVVKSIDPGSAASKHMQEGDVIDLDTIAPDRRPINKFLFVAHDQPYTLQVRRNAKLLTLPELIPIEETLSWVDAGTLLLAQISGFFFVALCAYLVWRHPSPQAWGLFLYSVWFNSGQYFVWYANLSKTALGWFNMLQSLFQALGLAGFLVFALYFPFDVVRGWRRRLAPLIAIPGVALFVFSVWAFQNYSRGWKTETPYWIYYRLTFVVYLLIVILFVYTYATQPAERPRLRWIMLGGVWGLVCFLSADAYESTTMLDALGNWLARLRPWLETHFGVSPQAFLNFLYAQNVFLPAAAVYTLLRHRVMGLRFVVTRAVVFTGVWSVVLISLVVLHVQMEELVREWAGRATFVIGVALTGLISISHGPLHHLVEGLLFRRWRRAEQRLRTLAEQLTGTEELNLADVNHMLVQEPVDALRLSSAALFRRRDSTFDRQDTVRWPDDLMRTLNADNPIVASLTGPPRKVRDQDDDDGVRPADLSMPAIAVPVVIRRTVSRVAFFGPHVTGEDLDPDELRVIHELARAAAIAYSRLDAEALLREVEELRARFATPSNEPPAPKL